MISGSRFRLAAAADADLDGILDQTLKRFGTKQYEAYAALIESALGLVAEESMRSGSKDRSDLIPEMRSFPVGLAAGRRGASAHVLFYVPDRSAGEGVLVVRILHEAMDPRGHFPGDAG